MVNQYISEVAWNKILTFLRSVGGLHCANIDRLKNFIEAIFWMVRGGTPWRLLDSRFGRWNSIFKRFNSWCKKGIWEKLLQFCIENPDLEHVMIDSTIVRAHHRAAGYGKQAEEGLGRSRGGFTSKIHAIVDALGNLLRFSITPGQTHDITQASKLLDGFTDAAVIADKGYDSDELRNTLKQNNCSSVIPPRKTRKNQYPYDKHLYKERHLIEGFFSKLKEFRRLATRYDKSARSFGSFIAFVGALLWLR